MNDYARIARIATARARNLAPWGELRTLAGGKGQPVIGTDARIKDITRALKTDPKQARRILYRIWLNDLRVVWYMLRLSCGC